MKRTDRTYSLDNRPPHRTDRLTRYREAISRNRQARASTAAISLLKGHINAHHERERLEAVRLRERYESTIVQLQRALEAEKGITFAATARAAEHYEECVRSERAWAGRLRIVAEPQGVEVLFHHGPLELRTVRDASDGTVVTSLHMSRAVVSHRLLSGLDGISAKDIIDHLTHRLVSRFFMDVWTELARRAATGKLEPIVSAENMRKELDNT